MVATTTIVGIGLGISIVATSAKRWAEVIRYRQEPSSCDGGYPLLLTVGRRMYNEPRDSLPRLEVGFYRGQAFIHWVMAIKDRKTGWLIPVFHYKFREILTHAAFRYGFACPAYCLMPDHMHMVWFGIDDQSDQLKAAEYFRKRLGEPLRKMGYEFQHQPYDHVLKEEERLESELSNLVEYIARNPERKNLVGADQFKTYPYTDCLVPGYPELEIWQTDFWTRFWRCYSFLRKNGMFRPADESL